MTKAWSRWELCPCHELHPHLRHPPSRPQPRVHPPLFQTCHDSHQHEPLLHSVLCRVLCSHVLRPHVMSFVDHTSLIASGGKGPLLKQWCRRLNSKMYSSKLYISRGHVPFRLEKNNQ